MDNDNPRQGGHSATDLVAEAEAQVLRLGRRLGAIIAQIDAGEVGAVGEVPAVLTALDKALGAVFSERARRERNGGGEGLARGELDLAAAQAEVGRRLDRLRSVACAGELSGGDG